jgi:hypothetical protein
MQKQSLLFSPGPASEPYEAIRDASHLADVKAFLEDLWTQYAPYADRHFLTEIRKENQFYQRLWELHLGCVLLHQRYQLTQVSDQGPDFLLRFEHKNVWIEAITPGAGTGNDAVPPLQWNSGECQEVPQEQILLRFTQAVDAKWKKYKEYVEKSIIEPDDCYIIAISGCYWHTPMGDNDIPYIIRAVLPFGTAMVGFGREPDDSVEGGYSYREHIQKQGGAPVSTKMFLNEEYADISAIIHSEENLINIPQPLGKDYFLYLHNPLAKNKLPRGAFKFCKEYWYLLDRTDTMLVRWFHQRAAVGKLLFHHSQAITMEEKAHDHPSDSQRVGAPHRGYRVCRF